MTVPPFKLGLPRQRGVSVITAVFLLLLFAGLAALMANLISTSHTTSAQDVLGSRAYQAARAGVEWGLYQVLAPDATPPSAVAPLPVCFGDTQLTLLDAGVTVACTVFPAVTATPDYYEEGTKRFRIYRIVAEARLQGPGLVIERRVEVSAEKCRDSASTEAPFDC